MKVSSIKVHRGRGHPGSTISENYPAARGIQGSVCCGDHVEVEPSAEECLQPRYQAAQREARDSRCTSVVDAGEGIQALLKQILGSVWAGYLVRSSIFQ
jgi:hypothetical protein